MSEYAGVTPIPDYFNISDWYELVDGDAIPNGWLAIELYPNGSVDIIRESYGYQQIRSVRHTLKNRHRLFTRTPPPSAIKRIRAAETKQDELPVELQELRDKLVGHTDLEAMSRRLTKLEQQVTKLEDNLTAFIDGA